MKFLEANLPPELSTRSPMVYKQLNLSKWACVIAGKDEKSIFLHAHAPNRETLPLSCNLML